MSEFICMIEAAAVGAHFLASAGPAGAGWCATSTQNRTHAAFTLAKIIGHQRNMTLVAFNDLGNGTFHARFSATPEAEAEA